MTQATAPDVAPATAPQWFRWLLAAIISLTLVSGAGTILNLARLYTSRNNGEVLNIIRDTVDPGGSRYERAQKAGAAGLELLVSYNRDANTVAVYCATHADTSDLAAVKTCVDGQFAKLHPPTPTTATPKVKAGAP